MADTSSSSVPDLEEGPLLSESSILEEEAGQRPPFLLRSNNIYSLGVEEHLSSLESNQEEHGVNRGLPHGLPLLPGPEQGARMRERPKTEGQSVDSPQRMRGVANPTKKLPNLQNRLEDLRVSLEVAGLTSATDPELVTSAETSPGRLPKVRGITRERYMSHDPFDMSGLESSVPPSPSTRLIDRATSPSVASVTSAHSAASSTPGAIRRNLEWDSAADLGYMGAEAARLPEVAASLSTLEKHAIGNYSHFWREDPEGKPAKKEKRRQLPPGPDVEEELRQARLHKFADSLLKQRQLRQMAMVREQGSTAADGPAKSKVEERRRRRSKSVDSKVQTPESSPSRRKKVKPRIKYGSPVKSSSLTDLNYGRQHHKNESQSSGSPLLKSAMTQPSSFSSTGTVVPILIDDNIKTSSSSLKKSSETVIESCRKLPVPRVLDSDSFDTEDEVQLIRRAARAKCVPDHPESSSEDDKKKSGTLESGPTIDRAKSFEYFPGEIFPLQENSSSYEYLPGHLVNAERPRTVMGNTDKPDNPGVNRISSPSDHGNEDYSSSSPDSHGNLMVKYREVYQANVNQTKQFFKGLKKYIEFISTPSQSPEDCQVKKAIAEEIEIVLKDEELKVSSGKPIVSLLDVPSKAPLPQSSLPPMQNWTDSPSLNMDLEIQRLRIEQMKKLRKEIRKLEKLECIRLNKALGLEEGNEELLNQVTGSLQTSCDSLSTDMTDIEPPVSRMSKKAPKADNNKRSPSETLKNAKKPNFNHKCSKTSEAAEKSWTDSVSTKASESIRLEKKAKKRQVIEGKSASGSDNIKSSTSTDSLPRQRRPMTSKAEKEDFSQMFPTPRGKVDNRRKSLAYYLPVDNISQIKIGSRRIKSSGNGLTMEEFLAKENRDILANYISAVESSAYKLQRNERIKTPKTSPRPTLSLQEALSSCRPEFIKRSRCRVEILQEIRDQRLEFEDKKRRYLENLATNRPKNQKLIDTVIQMKPPPRKRLFNHRRMVEETRQKYLQLPEVIQMEINDRKKSRDRTNRLMAAIYRRQLKDRVLKRNC